MPARRAQAAESVAERRHIAGILACVDRDAHVSQRRLASELGIALGLVNLYLKRCAKKGLIKVQQVPPRRYGYYLTAKGFTEKSRLTVEYLSWSLTFFRRARGEYGAAMSDARERGWGRVGLAGCSDLAEIASMLAADHKVVIGVVWSPGAAVDKLAGVRVVADLDSVAGQVDGWIVTAIEGAQEVYDAVVGKIGPERVLAPALLSVRVASPRATKPRGQR